MKKYSISIMITLSFSLSAYSASTLIVRGHSMFPTLRDSKKIRVLYGYYKGKKILQGDIIIAKIAANKNQIVKFVKAIPGDSFKLKFIGTNCHLIINNKIQQNSVGDKYIFDRRKCKMLSLYITDYKNKIPKESYLLLGDQSRGTKDATAFGLISKEDIIGKVISK